MRIMKFFSLFCIALVALACLFASPVSAQADGPPKVIDRICRPKKCDAICAPKNKKGRCKALKICECIDRNKTYLIIAPLKVPYGWENKSKLWMRHRIKYFSGQRLGGYNKQTKERESSASDSQTSD
ncbi:hypothetical protein TSAR_012966 [Trichomalopsis sarcophagae]|uniref:Uncharacterized protein n=1 Tax=Trichomalopsis sarcophagae TaxID=543379 RepID=A0A232EFZ0_9HYME|nr:hypothetical protein TSAR_012966 [Trichomalopsis sarcophagae]